MHYQYHRILLCSMLHTCLYEKVYGGYDWRGRVWVGVDVVMLCVFLCRNVCRSWEQPPWHRDEGHTACPAALLPQTVAEHVQHRSGADPSGPS